MKWYQKAWNTIEHHRYTVVTPVIGGLIWVAAVGCTPMTTSPLDEAKLVNASQLSIEFKSWEARQAIVAAKFEAAGEDLTRQAEANEAFKQTLLELASGSVADWSGLVQLLVGGGLLGVVGDNIRKNGVIGGLKRNKV
jgi:hypothetical protein